MSPALEYGVRPPNYRLPEATRLGRAVLQVSDLGRSVAYYTSVVGLRVLHERASSAILGPHDDSTPLIELREQPGARPVPEEGRLGLFHVALLVPSRPVLARVLRRLFRQSIRPAMADHFVSEALYLWDPDGLGLEIYADRPRSVWRAEGRQLYLTTERLDVSGLLAEADQGPDGLPGGSVVGHVHFSVDDLGQAAAFFHAAVGFDRTVWTYPGALFMSAGGYHHHVGTNTWARGASVATDEDARLLQWEVVVPTDADVAAVLASVRHAGLAPRGHTVTDPWGVELAFSVPAPA